MGMWASILRSSARRCTRKSPLKIFTPFSTPPLDSCSWAGGWMEKPPPSKRPQYFSLQGLHRVFTIRFEGNFPVMAELADTPERCLDRLLTLHSFRLNDLRTNCLRVSVLLKEDSDLILAISSTKVAVIHANFGNIADICWHGMVRLIVSSLLHTFGTPNSKRQMCCLMGFPVHQTWCARTSQGNASSAPSTAHGSSPAPACPAAAPSGKRTSAGEAATCSLSTACKGCRRWNGLTGSACGNSCRCLGAVSPLDGCRCELTDSPATEKDLTSPPQ